MITSVNEILYDDQAIRAASSAGTADDANSSSFYTYVNRYQSMAIDEACGAHVTLMVTETFNNLTNMECAIYHKIEGAGWIGRRHLVHTILLAKLTAGTILFDGQISSPLGDTAAMDLTVMVKFDLQYVGTTPTTGKLWASFATESGLGSDDPGLAQMGDGNVAALKIAAGSGITR